MVPFCMGGFINHETHIMKFISTLAAMSLMALTLTSFVATAADLRCKGSKALPPSPSTRKSSAREQAHSLRTRTCSRTRPQPRTCPQLVQNFTVGRSFVPQLVQNGAEAPLFA